MKLQGVGFGVEGAAGGAALHLVHHEALRGGRRRRVDHAESRFFGFGILFGKGQDLVEDVDTDEKEKDSKH